MVKNSDTLKKIRENLKNLVKFSNELTTDIKFSNFDLTNGTKITSPDKDLSVGSEVYALDDKQNQTPLEDGDYVLTDGRTITIKDSAITNVAESGGDDSKDGDESDEEMAKKKDAVKMEDGLPDDQKAKSTDSDSNELASRVADLEKQIEDILNVLKQSGDKQGQVNEQMMSKLDEVAKENGGKPIKHIKKTTTNDNTYSKEEIKGYLKDLFDKKNRTIK